MYDVFKSLNLIIKLWFGAIWNENHQQKALSRVHKVRVRAFAAKLVQKVDHYSLNKVLSCKAFESESRGDFHDPFALKFSGIMSQHAPYINRKPTHIKKGTCAGHWPLNIQLHSKTMSFLQAFLYNPHLKANKTMNLICCLKGWTPSRIQKWNEVDACRNIREFAL